MTKKNVKQNKILKLSIPIIILEFIWIAAAIGIFGYFYSLLDLSHVDAIIQPPRFYDFWGFKDVPEATLNVIMSYSVLVLCISVPLFVFNSKSIRQLREGKYDRGTGIYHALAAALSIVALNIPNAVLYTISSVSIFKEHPRQKKVKYTEQFEESVFERYRRVFIDILAHFLLVSFALIILIPFYMMIITALMSKETFSDFTQVTFYLRFKDMHWINIKEALQKADFALYIKNTLIVAGVTTIGTVITTILAAFAFARIEFKGRDFVFSLLLMTMMVPGELYILTNFVTVARPRGQNFSIIDIFRDAGFGWYNTYQAMIFPFIVSVFYIYFLRQTFKQIPDTLYKAAKVDGCSDFKFLTRIMLPIASPTIITITILSALGTWNAYVWPRLVTEQDKWLVSIALRRGFVDTATGMTDYRLQMAAAAIVTVPILVVFLFTRKYIMRGVGRSGIKG